MIDLLIQNGLIVDGTASPSYRGDVAVRDGKILAVAPHIEEAAAEVVNADGLVVSPAFIDMHSHSDSWFMVDDKCEAKLYQGVATEIVGNCGSSQFPRNVEDTTKVNKLREEGKLSVMGSYQAPDFKKLITRRRGSQKMSTNLIQLVGHNAIRKGVVGLVKRESGYDEIQLEKYLLTQALDQGCWGMSLGLEYLPGRFAGHAELTELAKQCYIYGVPITVHMKSESYEVFESLKEMIDIARETHVHMHISHFKISCKRYWGRVKETYQMIQDAKKEGLNISCDMYPYNACASGMSNLIPDWVLDGGGEAAAKRLENDPKARAEVMEILNKDFPDYEDGNIYYISCGGKFAPEYSGRRAGDIAKEMGLSNPEGMFAIMLKTRFDDDCIISNMNMDDVMWLLGKDDITIGSDASCRPFDPKYSAGGLPHPRTYATFPRFLRLVRENNLCSLETAVHRITRMPASYIGLKDRGTLEAGKVADITIFDYEGLKDHASYENPFRKCDGIEHVIMNGRFALKNGVQTEERLGDYLLRK